MSGPGAAGVPSGGPSGSPAGAAGLAVRVDRRLVLPLRMLSVILLLPYFTVYGFLCADTWAELRLFWSVCFGSAWRSLAAREESHA